MEKQSNDDTTALGAPWSDFEFALLQAGFVAGLPRWSDASLHHATEAIKRLGVQPAHPGEDMEMLQAWESESEKVCGVLLALTCIALVRELSPDARERLQSNVAGYLDYQRGYMRKVYGSAPQSPSSQSQAPVRSDRGLQRLQARFGRLLNFFWR